MESRHKQLIPNDKDLPEYDYYYWSFKNLSSIVQDPETGKIKYSVNPIYYVLFFKNEEQVANRMYSINSISTLPDEYEKQIDLDDENSSELSEDEGDDDEEELTAEQQSLVEQLLTTGVSPRHLLTSCQSTTFPRRHSAPPADAPSQTHDGQQNHFSPTHTK